MPKTCQQIRRRKSMSTHPMGGRRQSLSVPRQLLTDGGQQSHSFRQHAENTATSTRNIGKKSQNTQSESGNDPQLLAVIFKATVEAMHALKMLALVKTTSGKLLIILPTHIFNDDLTLK